MTKKTSVIVGVIVLIIVIALCGFLVYRSFQTKEVAVQPSVQVPVNSTSSNEGTQVTPTATTTTVSPTATPVPGSCLVLQQQYCNMVKLVTLSDGTVVASFELPAGVPIFSPYTGVILLGSGGPSYSGKEHSMIALDGVTSDIAPQAKTANALTIAYTGVQSSGISSGVLISKGEVLATTGATNTDKVEELNMYNLLMGFTKGGPFGAADNAKTNEVFSISQQ